MSAVASASRAAAAADTSTRLHSLDALRVAAFVVLVLYHVGMYYVDWPWHVKSPQASAALRPWMTLSSPWRMSLLFFVSGAALAWSLRGAAPRPGWLRRRAARLLLPLLAGMLLIVPLQSFEEVRQFHGYRGGWWDFMALYYRGYGGFCQPGRGCLMLPTWNHLWFLPYLFSYCVVLWALLRAWPQALAAAGPTLARALRGARLWWLPLAWLLATRAALAGRFPPTHAWVDDVFLHSQYLACFLFGAAWAREEALWQRARAGRHAALALALLAWVVLVWGGPGWPRPVAASAMQWWAVLAACGYASHHVRGPLPGLRAASEAVFPLYLVHQSVIIGLAVASEPLRWPVAAQAALLVTGAWVAGLLAWQCGRRVPALGRWLGVPAR